MADSVLVSLPDGREERWDFERRRQDRSISYVYSYEITETEALRVFGTPYRWSEEEGIASGGMYDIYGHREEVGYYRPNQWSRVRAYDA